MVIVRSACAWLSIVLLVGGCREPAGEAAADLPQRPNILLITIESLRADHVGCYGCKRETTPSIDAVALEGVIYEQAFSTTSWTLTSHASLFTGLYPAAHQVILPRDRLGDDYTTMAELLSAGGYQCAGVVGGPYLRTTFNLQQGFEYYDQEVAGLTNEAAHKDATNPRMAKALERFLRTERDARRPFFLFAYYWDVHYNYIPPEPYDVLFVPEGAEPIESVQFGPLTELGRDLSQSQLDYLIAQYDGEIRCTDEHLGRLWALLRELNLWDNTAIILTADHGEQFFEHNFLGHKYDLFAESLHVPLILKRPGRSMAKRRDGRVVSLVDVFPTILELAGQECATVHHGRSLLGPAVEQRATYYDLTTTWTLTDRATGQKRDESDHWLGIRQGRYKLVHLLGTRFWQLFDAVDDPGEQKPLGAEFQSTALELDRKLTEWQTAMQKLSTLWGKGVAAELSKEEQQRLRSLGYLP